MTVSSNAARVGYAGDGATATFAIPFYILDADDLTVILRDAAGAETVWTRGAEYTVSGAGNPAGASITVSTGPINHTPAGGTTLVILRSVPLTQETDYTEGDPLPAATLERDFDKARMVDQQISETLDRALKFADSSTVAGITVPDPAADQVMKWNAAADGLENWATVTDISAVAAVADDIDVLAAIAADVTTAVAMGANITTVAGIASAVVGVAGIAADVAAVVGIAGPVTTVAAARVDIQALGPISADIATVAGMAADVSAVAADAADIGTVAGIGAAVAFTAGIAAHVTAVAGMGADVAAVAGISAEVSAVAANVAGIRDFADLYQIAEIAPTTRADFGPLEEGDLYFNTTSDTLFIWNGGNWIEAAIPTGGTVPVSRTLTAGTGLTGGGNLAEDRSFALDAAAQAGLALAGGALQRSHNLADVESPAIARSHLGLGNAAKLDVDQAWTGVQRSPFIANTDGNLDLAAAQNFKVMPNGAITLRATNLANGRSGVIILDNNDGLPIGLGAGTAAPVAMATDLSAPGIYLLGYVTDGAKVYLTGSEALV